MNSTFQLPHESRYYLSWDRNIPPKSKPRLLILSNILLKKIKDTLI